MKTQHKIISLWLLFACFFGAEDNLCKRSHQGAKRISPRGPPELNLEREPFFADLSPICPSSFLTNQSAQNIQNDNELHRYFLDYSSRPDFPIDDYVDIILRYDDVPKTIFVPTAAHRKISAGQKKIKHSSKPKKPLSKPINICKTNGLS